MSTGYARDGQINFRIVCMYSYVNVARTKKYSVQEVVRDIFWRYCRRIPILSRDHLVPLKNYKHS